MAGVIDQIKSWAVELPYWERSALERVVRGTPLTTQDYDELLSEYMQDAGLAPMPEKRPALIFSQTILRTTPSAKCRLERLFDLSNVNALPAGQELQFGPQLTLVYGDNAAGKSGYTRALGCAAFARGEREVLPDARKSDSKRLPEAKIEVCQAETKRVVTWTAGQHCPELAGFHVYDGSSLSAHLTGSNPISFAPAGLSLLTTLAEVTDEIRARLRATIDQRDAAHDFGSWFEGESPIRQKMEVLDAHTDLAELEKLGQLTDDEIAQISQLEKEIYDLKSTNLASYKAKRLQEVSDLERLIKAIPQAEQSLGDRTAEEVAKLISNLESRRLEVGRSGTDQFKSDVFTQIGSDAWRQFVVAAKILADAERTQGPPYPQAGDFCLLCRQSLPGEAITLIQKMWEFLRSDAQAHLDVALQEREKKVRDLRSISLNYFEGDSSARRLLESELPILVPAIVSHTDACSARRQEMIECLQGGQMRTLSPSITPDVADIRKIIEMRTAEIGQLAQDDTSERVRKCESTLRHLRHRRIVGQKMSEFKGYVARKKWVSRARNSIGTTRHITMKYNELFKELVTDEYARLFQTTLERFKSKLLVTVETRGQKGETVRQIKLSPKAFATRFPVEKILSDGEKTAVAIADFLTEAAMSEFSSGMILDDPITSLDNNWKAILAQCLAEHGESRQVIVFTHDLPFLYHITQHAKQLGVAVVTHWIREEDGQPGFVYAGNSPVCEAEFKSAQIARECYSKSKDLEPATQQFWLQQGFGALRTSYEALVIFELFNGVVLRFEDRIGFDRLKSVRLEPKLVEEIVERMGFLSRHIVAHLHSDKFVATKPTPAILLEEIETFERMKKSVKAYKNASDGLL